MRRILVTAVSGDIANNILKILIEDGNCVVYGTDVNPIAVGMDLVEEFYQVPYAVDDNYIDVMLDICSKRDITHLIPTNEREVEVVGRNRQVFEDAGIKVMVQAQNVLDICLDKFETAVFLQQHNLDVPGTLLSVEDVSDGRKFIAKGRKSNGSRAVMVINNKQEYIDRKYNLTDVVFQDYIDGDEYTIGVFGHDGVYSAIPFKRQLEDGHSCIVELKNTEEFIKTGLEVAKAFELEGYINVQLRRCNDTNYIFEINPRISGTVAFRHELGFEDVLWWLDILDDKLEWQGYQCEYTQAIGIREMCHKFLKLERL